MRQDSWLSAADQKEDQYSGIREVLMSTYNSSPYMENFVQQALYQMGYAEDAMQRLKSQYATFIEDEWTTVGEFFEIILYDHGFNCWHHYGENGVRKFYNAAKLLEKNLFSPGVPHTLTVKLFRRAGRRFLEVSGSGKTLGVCLPQMFSGDCRIGIAASEGVDFFRSVKISRP